MRKTKYRRFASRSRSRRSYHVEKIDHKSSSNVPTRQSVPRFVRQIMVFQYEIQDNAIFAISRGRLAKYFTLNWKQQNEKKIFFSSAALPSTTTFKCSRNFEIAHKTAKVNLKKKDTNTIFASHIKYISMCNTQLPQRIASIQSTLTKKQSTSLVLSSIHSSYIGYYIPAQNVQLKCHVFFSEEDASLLLCHSQHQLGNNYVHKIHIWKIIWIILAYELRRFSANLFA